MAKLIDMTGMRIGRLTVIERAGSYVFPKVIETGKQEVDDAKSD